MEGNVAMEAKFDMTCNSLGEALFLAPPKIKNILVETSSLKHAHFAASICHEIEASAKARGTGIARRPIDYIERKLTNGQAIIATDKISGEWASFCYIETWGDDKFVSNSGLIVVPKYRGISLSFKIKKMAFLLSRTKYPKASLFGLTTSQAVMNVNSKLGYRPVIFSNLTDDERFWKGCLTCKNYDTLASKNFNNCFCTAMLWSPEDNKSTLSKFKAKLIKFKNTK